MYIDKIILKCENCGQIQECTDIELIDKNYNQFVIDINDLENEGICNCEQTENY